MSTRFSMRMLLCGITVSCSLASVSAQVATGSMDIHWDEGSPECGKSAHSPLQVHTYNPQTFILRESLCSTFEAPFLYLLLGSSKALLIDTGDVADSQKMPLAKTVLDLVPQNGSGKLPLLVVHTHRHLDHRSGDGQFTSLPSVQVVGYDLPSVKRFYQFSDWPNGIAQIDLGERVVDVIPSPGHNETEVSFYDRSTALLFSGDFLMPARLLIDDTRAEQASAERLAVFVKDRPVSYILGGHIETDTNGHLFPWESQNHPQEHALQMTKADVFALPAAVRKFNGFYTEDGTFVMMNSMRILLFIAAVTLVLIIALGWLLVRYFRRRRQRAAMNRQRP